MDDMFYSDSVVEHDDDVLSFQMFIFLVTFFNDAIIIKTLKFDILGNTPFLFLAEN